MSGSTTAPFRFFSVTVSRLEDLTPSIRRLTLTGPDLERFGDPGWDQRIKLVLPSPTAGYDRLPTGEGWYRQWLALPEELRPPIRTYTTRAVRRRAREVDIDVVLHGPSGPAGRWVQAARPGSRAVLLGPDAGHEGDPGGVDFVPPRVTERFLLGGDETAAPAISRILEDLPPSARGVAVVELPTRADVDYLPTHPGFEMRILSREGRSHGELLVNGVRAAAAELCPPGAPQEVEEIDVDRDLLWEVPRTAKGGAALKRTTLYAWLAGEAGAVRAMRRHLVAECGIDRRSVAFMGYWRLGRPEG
ncbi:siderophore-interacting protein [Actinomyces bowdenii]|uniref:Siderophore-interacting protein n=1 Tax=Actinomyces bowdenii TaxID=131109 RepID=A0A3P1V907_9ACTO|nr:siderophore-interacting protein [Actinomyces bowdenii]RRD30137.1 siderophore-interacting protein [Actinomyces bowdenii]